jgi:hypothetical protein
MKGKCKRCGQDKRIVSRGFCSNCYRLVLLEEKKTGTPYAFPTPVPPAFKDRTISHTDILLETIVKENKIKNIKVEFGIGISINNIKVTSIS